MSNTSERNEIGKNLVHKVQEENVFLKDLRRLLPPRVTPELMQAAKTDSAVGAVFTRWYGSDYTRPDISRIPAKEQTVMARFIEEQRLVPDTEEYLGEMQVRVGHTFFFEHGNDHVPGLMLIEAFRQFAVACSHRFGKVPEGEAQMILSVLDSRFANYAELFMPLTFYGKAEVKWNKRGYWSDLDLATDAYQRGTLLASFRLCGQSIPTPLYRRMRDRRLDSLIGEDRFFLRPERRVHAELVNETDLTRERVLLQNIGLGGFAVRATEDGPKNDKGLLFLEFEGGTNIHARCHKKWVDEEQQLAGYEITAISPEDYRVLSRGIAVNGLVNEERHYHDIGK